MDTLHCELVGEKTQLCDKWRNVWYSANMSLIEGDLRIGHHHRHNHSVLPGRYAAVVSYLIQMIIEICPGMTLCFFLAVHLVISISRFVIWVQELGILEMAISIGKMMINHSILGGPMFRNTFQKFRCLPPNRTIFGWCPVHFLPSSFSWHAIKLACAKAQAFTWS